MNNRLKSLNVFNVNLYLFNLNVWEVIIIIMYTLLLEGNVMCTVTSSVMCSFLFFYSCFIFMYIIIMSMFFLNLFNIKDRQTTTIHEDKIQRYIPICME